MYMEEQHHNSGMYQYHQYVRGWRNNGRQHIISFSTYWRNLSLFTDTVLTSKGVKERESHKYPELSKRLRIYCSPVLHNLNTLFYLAVWIFVNIGIPRLTNQIPTLLLM